MRPKLSLATPLFLILLLPSIACRAAGGAKLPGEDAPSAIRLTSEAEPGPALEVEGTVYAPDGETPAPGVILYVYQTDRTGRYAETGDIPRLRGYMKTDAQGRYRYRTIRPASYPDSTIAAHVHTQTWGGGHEPQWNTDLLFADDPFLAEDDRRQSGAAGRFAWVCSTPPDASGVTRCTHNLRLKPRGDLFEESIRHGLDSPPS